ncbi:PIN domain-containing protein [Chromatocurvus halotolerans]|uniref:PIN domain-containing protein n=1 Tax=Chromatocurvus halotolerans TaxID=1132028 RepID=A0A4V2SBG2_9GAMM|nr:PIN domain-containing protein [Chromatocurvus halotolerans]TCO75380.1 PIN domain-containing protein [Chromatocurvus halotolerans]
MTLVDTCGWIDWLTEGILAESFTPYMHDPADLSLSHKLAFADAVIYASARKYDAELVTSDNHFEGLPGVSYFQKKSL